MKKSELIEAIATDAEISKSAATKAVEAFINKVITALQNEEDVSLVGFGTFTVRKRAKRSGRNPQTGETITIKAASMPAFKAGKAFKDAISGKVEEVI